MVEQERVGEFLDYNSQAALSRPPAETSQACAGSLTPSTKELNSKEGSPKHKKRRLPPSFGQRAAEEERSEPAALLKMVEQERVGEFLDYNSQAALSATARSMQGFMTVRFKKIACAPRIS